ncbi:MazG-like family protein [Loigolactobacillus zhaoyuanensis]|uniref:MazG-like family protein n=1 Tax=Loigolactobacillus zhaoyuanensis TaxID=2486017 RepID=A0ABW8UDI2_9LACO|nr:MazG-like family protein [Loigolactobacillus zhaoyuanensis]
MNELWSTVKQLSQKEPKTLEQQAIKLSEEVGEAAEALLSMEGVSGDGYKHLTRDAAKEEYVDVLLVTLALLQKLETSDAELTSLLQQKLAKWQAKQD